MIKIYSVRNGNIIFILMLFLFAFSMSIGFLLISHKEAIGLFCCSVLFAVSAIILVHRNYLNYILVDQNGISLKNRLYTWDEIYITVDYSEPDQYRNAYVYQFYFGLKFLLERQDRRHCKKEGFFIDIDKKRLGIILKFYEKKFLIVRESPLQKDILTILKEHNFRLCDHDGEFDGKASGCDRCDDKCYGYCGAYRDGNAAIGGNHD